MTKLYFENIILGLAYAIIDSVKVLPRANWGNALDNTSRLLAPAIAFTYACGYQFGKYYHRLRATVEKHIILGERV